MYEQTYKRLEKLKKTFDAVVKRNLELEEALKIARINKETYELRDQARDRILISLSEKIKEEDQDGQGISPPT